MTMDNLVHNLAIARSTTANLKAELAQVNAEAAAMVKERFGERIKQLTDWLSRAQADLEANEQAVRETALEAYLETGNKHPHPAITIKVFTKLDYDEEQAVTYCVEHLPKALKVDKRKFEAVAKAAELDFVQITDDPKATVATDLSEYEGVREPGWCYSCNQDFRTFHQWEDYKQCPRCGADL